MLIPNLFVVVVNYILTGSIRDVSLSLQMSLGVVETHFQLLATLLVSCSLGSKLCPRC